MRFLCLWIEVCIIQKRTASFPISFLILIDNDDDAAVV